MLSTAREVTDLGFVTTVIEEGCGDREERKHVVVMDVLGMTCSVLKVEEWIETFQGGKGKKTSDSVEKTY